MEMDCPHGIPHKRTVRHAELVPNRTIPNQIPVAGPLTAPVAGPLTAPVAASVEGRAPAQALRGKRPRSDDVDVEPDKKIAKVANFIAIGGPGEAMPSTSAAINTDSFPQTAMNETHAQVERQLPVLQHPIQSGWFFPPSVAPMGRGRGGGNEMRGLPQRPGPGPDYYYNNMGIGPYQGSRYGDAYHDQYNRNYFPGFAHDNATQGENRTRDYDYMGFGPYHGSGYRDAYRPQYHRNYFPGFAPQAGFQTRGGSSTTEGRRGYHHSGPSFGQRGGRGSFPSEGWVTQQHEWVNQGDMRWRDEVESRADGRLQHQHTGGSRAFQGPWPSSYNTGTDRWYRDDSSGATWK